MVGIWFGVSRRNWSSWHSLGGITIELIEIVIPAEQLCTTELCRRVKFGRTKLRRNYRTPPATYSTAYQRQESAMSQLPVRNKKQGTRGSPEQEVRPYYSSGFSSGVAIWSRFWTGPISVGAARSDTPGRARRAQKSNSLEDYCLVHDMMNMPSRGSV